MNSPERKSAAQGGRAPSPRSFTARIVRTGFDQWFRVAHGASPPAAWKQNMLVLMTLYPVVFIFGSLVQTPLLTKQGVPFWLALFIGNIVSVLLLSWLVPWTLNASTGGSRQRVRR